MAEGFAEGLAGSISRVSERVSRQNEQRDYQKFLEQREEKARAQAKADAMEARSLMKQDQAEGRMQAAKDQAAILNMSQRGLEADVIEFVTQPDGTLKKRYRTPAELEKILKERADAATGLDDAMVKIQTDQEGATSPREGPSAVLTGPTPGSLTAGFEEPAQTAGMPEDFQVPKAKPVPSTPIGAMYQSFADLVSQGNPDLQAQMQGAFGDTGKGRDNAKLAQAMIASVTGVLPDDIVKEQMLEAIDPVRYGEYKWRKGFDDLDRQMDSLVKMQNVELQRLQIQGLPEAQRVASMKTLGDLQEQQIRMQETIARMERERTLAAQQVTAGAQAIRKGELELGATEQGIITNYTKAVLDPLAESTGAQGLGEWFEINAWTDFGDIFDNLEKVKEFASQGLTPVGETAGTPPELAQKAVKSKTRQLLQPGVQKVKDVTLDLFQITGKDPGGLAAITAWLEKAYQGPEGIVEFKDKFGFEVSPVQRKAAEGNARYRVVAGDELKNSALDKAKLSWGAMFAVGTALKNAGFSKEEANTFAKQNFIPTRYLAEVKASRDGDAQKAMNLYNETLRAALIDGYESE